MGVGSIHKQCSLHCGHVCGYSKTLLQLTAFSNWIDVYLITFNGVVEGVHV